ncbi:MAG TPA: YceI family protein [Terriglobales bacterium]|nr:YceI family protein [Terriglobales bacterium]
MRISKALRLFAVAFMLVGVSLAADEFKIDPSHSAANFTVKHMLISTVHGRFSSVSGTIVFDEKDPSKCSVDAVIKADSITTDNEGRDKHLKSADFFDVEKFPEITFKSKKVEKRGNQWVAIGTLTMKGVAKDVELPFEVAKLEGPRGTTIGVGATTELNRQDYGVSWSRKLDNGGMVVADTVKIELNLEARAPRPAAAAAPAAAAPAAAAPAKK